MSIIDKSSLLSPLLNIILHYYAHIIQLYYDAVKGGNWRKPAKMSLILTFQITIPTFSIVYGSGVVKTLSTEYRRYYL